MNYIKPTWNINDVIDLNIEQVPKPDIGFDVVNGTNVDKYQGIISAGVYRGLPNFFDKTIFEKEFNWIKNKGYAVHRMIPGTILPLHRDNYSYYATNNNITDLNNIIRVVLFLDDHKLGHILQIEGLSFANWSAGNYVFWQGKKAHMAANFGNEDRYTLQITGTL